MKTRRGSSLWPSTLSGAAMVNQYKPGDIVTSSLVRQSDFIGVVRGVDPKINKVWVAWAGGVVCQHDPDEIHFEPHQSETVKSRMASRRTFAGRGFHVGEKVSLPSNPWKETEGIVTRKGKSSPGRDEYDYYVKTSRHGEVGFSQEDLDKANKMASRRPLDRKSVV